MDKKYWFFGSKLNTILLVILIILMIMALKFMYKNQQVYTDSWKESIHQDDTQQPIQKDSIQIKNNSTKSNNTTYSFLLPILKDFPDSKISKCNIRGQTYITIVRDKIQNGSHSAGSGNEIFTENGTHIADCAGNPMSNPSICSELYKTQNTCTSIIIK